MDANQDRIRIIQFSFILVVLILISRLFYLQVVDDSYSRLAQINVVRKVMIYPSRGLIYDRNQELIVYNEAVYDLLVTPRQLREFDTLELCSLLEIDQNDLKLAINEATDYSRDKSSIIIKQIPATLFAKFQEYLFRYKGFYRSVRTIRKYPYSNAAHLLGYIGEINPEQLKQRKEYRMGDYIGVTGIEQSYEASLKGEKGVSYILVDAKDRKQGSFLDGAYDTLSDAGKNLHISLDINLQRYGERLMKGKIGSMVAIEPGTGEILVMLSSPAYDPNLLSGRQRGDNFEVLRTDTLNPLFNRSIQAEQYPPGSTFKPLAALIGLQEGVINPSSYYTCNGGYHMPGLTIGCLASGTFNLKTAIQKSCNAYFCNVYKRTIEQKKFKSPEEGFQNWRDYLTSFGLGRQLGLDIENEGIGSVPTVARYDSMYGKGRWKASTTISLAIGQGELGVTPLQLANVAATIANKGYFYDPHIMKKIEGDSSLGQWKKNISRVDPKYFDIVIEGMEASTRAGSSRSASIDGVTVCGKTGTSENPHGKDHSFFMGFAPKEDPKIAVMVIVENSGWGGSYAAPMGGLIMEKYITDTISRKKLWLEERMLNSQLVNR
ncbi:MAG: penicillin-binding protein 2 [Bacteroidetes bacterium]|nr:penicillin-binding protein 2 [Bacteroidota bacterium]